MKSVLDADVVPPYVTPKKVKLGTVTLDDPKKRPSSAMP